MHRTWDEARVTALADTLQDKLDKQGVESGGFSSARDSVVDPSKHFFQDPLDGLFFIMGFMAVITLILGLFLVYNTITALINRQINQIGILKAIGARTRVIFGLYLTIVFIYGVLALLVAIPLSALTARALGDFLLDSFNAENAATSSCRRGPSWPRRSLPCWRRSWLACCRSTPGRASRCARPSAPMG